MITEYSLFHLEITYIMFGNLREIFGISNSNIFEFCADSAFTYADSAYTWCGQCKHQK